LLGPRLFEEQLGSFGGDRYRVHCLTYGWQRGNLCQSAAHSILLLTHLCRFPVVSGGVDAPVEPVFVEHIQTVLESIQFNLIAP
jgi:hypothetical protein